MLYPQKLNVDNNIRSLVSTTGLELRKSSPKVELVHASCSRHLLCSENNGSPPQPQSDSISINSDLLKQIEPQFIATEPVFQFQSKPEVDLLAKVNIRKKQIENIILKHEQKQQAERKKNLLTKVQSQARQVIKKCKKVPQNHPVKWGHSPFVTGGEKENEEDKPQTQHPVLQRQRPKVQLKPIKERIAQYKKKEELLKIKSAENFNRPHREDINVSQCKQKIQKNAEKIIQQMKAQKQKTQEQKRVIQAKIRALQIQSLNKVTHAKKKPLESSLQFNLGDSVYSTFDARAEGRKKIKQKKNKQVIADPSLMETKKSKYLKAGSKMPRSTPRRDKNKTVEKNQQPNVRRQAQEGRELVGSTVRSDAQVKGPFFIWNIPIMPQDVNKLQNKSKDVFMNVDRFNYKSGKTFREEANEYLAHKMQKKMEDQKQATKQQRFLAEVSRKKQILDRQFALEERSQLQEVIWNEDEVFRPNVVQNFHFYTAENVNDRL